jgi:prepilin-type N-terminal cleavage/methylation domain-containing protein
MNRARARGFTLIEVTLAVAILALLVALVLQNMSNTIEGRDRVINGLRKPKVANALLAQFVKDLRYLWFGGLTGNAGFVGRHRNVNGKDADRIDFVTARTARSVVLDEESTAEEKAQAELAEVGYAFRARDDGRYLELWRREDPYVDDDPTTGGKYSLIYDRVRSFKITYFDRPSEAQGPNGQEEWDSRQKRRVPYAIVVDITFDAEEADNDKRDEEPERLRRIFLLKPGGESAVDWPSGTGAAGATPPK